jgi:hypothetical protein
MLSESGKMRKVQIDKLQLPDRLRILCRLYQQSPPISVLQLSASPNLPWAHVSCTANGVHPGDLNSSPREDPACSGVLKDGIRAN